MKSFKMMGFSPRQSKRGFTLIELLIVMVIIAILAGVIVMAIGGVFGNAKEAAYNTAKEQVQNAVTAYSANATHSGVVPYIAGTVFINQNCSTCYAVEIDLLLSANGGMLRQAPDGLALNSSGVDNCNTSATSGACKAANHYTWIVNANGDVFSYCVGDICGTGASANNSGYRQVWP